MEHSDCQHCLGIFVPNWIWVVFTTCWVLIQNTASPSTSAPSAVSPQQVLSWHRFWQGGWFSRCFQMLCDKSSETLSPTTLPYTKSLDGPTQKLFWVSSRMTTWRPRSSGSTSPWRCTPGTLGFPQPAPRGRGGAGGPKAAVEVMQLCQLSREAGSCPVFTEKATLVCRQNLTAGEGWETWLKVDSTKHRVARRENGGISDIARRLPPPTSPNIP